MSVNIWNKTTHILKRAAGKPGLFTRLLPGLVPTAPSGNGTSKYLREDGSWNEPSTNTIQNGTAQSAISTSIAAGTSVDNVAKTLLDNDATLKDALNTQIGYYAAPSNLSWITPWYDSSTNSFGFVFAISNSSKFEIRFSNNEKKLYARYYNGSSWQTLVTFTGA